MQHLRDGRMDFTALRYFSATAHSRSIRAAADQLHVSPSAISRQIAKLEHELRAPIFDRRAQGMRLTSAGEVLLTKIDGVMREFSRVKSHIAALQDIQAGTVDVCCFQTAIESFVAPVLNRFHAQYPQVSFNVRMSSTDEAMEASRVPRRSAWSSTRRFATPSPGWKCFATLWSWHFHPRIRWLDAK
jgi:DNA-binding transcriptional LysR family regulator